MHEYPIYNIRAANAARRAAPLKTVSRVAPEEGREVPPGVVAGVLGVAVGILGLLIIGVVELP